MRIGIDIPMTDMEGNLFDAAQEMAWAKMVEDSGLDGIWLGDASYNRNNTRTAADPIARVLLAAAGTTNIEVGLTVFQIPLREPVDTAQRFMTTAGLSGNRFTAGVGSGSTENGAFTSVGVPYEDRFKIFYKNIDVVRRLLKGETVGPASLPPWAETRGGPRLILGAWASEISIKHAVNEFDGWMSSRHTGFDVLAEGVKRYRDLGGTRAMTCTCPINLHPAENHAEFEGFNLVCSPTEAADRLHSLAEIGFDDVCMNYLAPGRDGFGGHPFTAEALEEIPSLVPKAAPIAF